MKAFVLASVLALAAAPAMAATIVNGSFEAGKDIAPGGFRTLAAGDSTTIVGWTVGGAGVDYIGTFWQAEAGLRSIDLSALNAGSVSQTLSTVVGKAYRVSFFLSGNPDGGVGVKTATVAATGYAPESFLYTVGAANSRANMLWERFAYTFRATAASTQLSFTGGNASPYGAALDNVAITAVPEPQTWAMLLIGAGMVGAARRFRRHRGEVTA